MTGKKTHLVWAALFLIIVSADQLTKHFVVRGISPGSKVVVINGLLNFGHSRNTGGAFSLFPDNPTLFLVLSLCALALLIYLYFKMAGKFWSKAAVVAITGGAVGNLIDRFRFGHVIDFIDVYWGAWHWYVFNVADAAITVGAAGLFVATVAVELAERRARKEEAARAEDLPGDTEEHRRSADAGK